MDLHRLLNPRSIAVVGATPRTDTYAHETLRNLAALGYEGEVWGVHPGHREALGRPVFPSLSDLPEPADAVVVAIPAEGVAAVVEEAGATGCGGAVVFGAGFAEGGPTDLEDRLTAAAVRHGLPVVGPNCDGLVRLHRRVALWGDALRPQEPGAVALVSQSGNLAVNALATRRGLRLHTVVSCGNQAVCDAGDLLAFLAEDDGVRSIALYLAGRLRAIAGAAGRGDPGGGARDGRAGRWLAEHEAKVLLRNAGVEVVAGRPAADEDDAVAAAREVGWPVAVKRSVAGLTHKTEAGALALGIGDEAALRAEYQRLAGHGEGTVLVEAMARGRVELLVAARRDAVVPALVIGLGGTWAELLDDVAVVPLPAGPERVARAIRSLRGAPLLCGGRGRPPLAVDAAARLAAAAGEALLEYGLEVLELNPVLVGRRGALALDAVAREAPIGAEAAA